MFGLSFAGINGAMDMLIFNAEKNDSAAALSQHTTRWPNRSTARSKPNSSHSMDHGKHAAISRLRSRNGSTGTTTADFTQRSVTSHPPNRKATGIVSKTCSPRPETYNPALHQTRDASPSVPIFAKITGVIELGVDHDFS